MQGARTWLPRGLAASAFAGYVWTAPPGLYWLDSSELAAGSFALGSVHPTGFPLFCVVGKLVTYHLEERQRARVITYGGSRVLDSDAIDKALREKDLALRVDAFTDPGLLARVRSTIRDLLEEKGYLDAVVAHSVTPVAGRPKVVNITFAGTLVEGQVAG